MRSIYIHIVRNNSLIKIGPGRLGIRYTAASAKKRHSADIVTNSKKKALILSV